MIPSRIRSFPSLFQLLYPLKQLLHRIFITLRKSKWRLCERLEIHRHIIKPVESTVAFHGIDDPSRTTSDASVVGHGAMSRHAMGISLRYSAQVAGKWETRSADITNAASTSCSLSTSTAVYSPGLYRGNPRVKSSPKG